jgi:hypothetical protein
LAEVLASVRADNGLETDTQLDVLGFLRHVSDILLMDEVKLPAKIGLALGEPYRARDFVRAYDLPTVRAQYPGLYYEAVHQTLLGAPPAGVDRQLAELIATTMLANSRPPWNLG